MPSHSLSRAAVVDICGSLGVFAFALTAWLSPIANNLALGLIVVALAVSPRARCELPRDPVFRFFLIFAAYLLVQTAWGIARFPETAMQQVTDYGKWLLLFGFLAIAWWLRADSKRIDRVLMAAALGLWIGLLGHAEWSNILAFRTGNQTGFRMSAACSGLVSATAILGLLLSSERIFLTTIPVWRRGSRMLVWGIGAYLSTYMLIASQSRTTWVAVAVVFPAVLGYRYFFSLRRRGLSAARFPYLLLVFAGLMGGGVWLNKDSLIRRIGPDEEVVLTILRGQDSRLPKLPESSIKYRYQIQKFGLEKWLERPWTGWGTGSTKHLIAASGRPGLWNTASGHWINHLHSAYLEILVRFGLFGTSLLAVGAWLSARKLWTGELARRMHGDHFLLFLGALGMVAIWASNVFQILTDPWRAYWLLLMGLGYTYVLHPATNPVRSKGSPA